MKGAPGPWGRNRKVTGVAGRRSAGAEREQEPEQRGHDDEGTDADDRVLRPGSTRPRRLGRLLVDRLGAILSRSSILLVFHVPSFAVVAYPRIKPPPRNQRAAFRPDTLDSDPCFS